MTSKVKRIAVLENRTITGLSFKVTEKLSAMSANSTIVHGSGTMEPVVDAPSDGMCLYMHADH
jgi:hypothetical protein